MIGKSRAEEWVERTLIAAKLSIRANFKGEMEKRIDYYNDRQIPYLMELLRERYLDWKSLGLEPEFINVIKTIVDGSALIYRSGASRTLTSGAGEVDPQEKKLWDWIMGNARYEATMKTVNRLAKLCRTVVIKPSFRRGCIRLDVLTPDQIDIIQEQGDPTEPRAIIYSRPGSDSIESMPIIYHYWDNEKYRRFTADGKIIRMANNPENINPYGVLPFVRFTETLPVSSYFVDSGEDLTVVQDAINLKLVQLNHLLKMQSFSVPVLIGYEGQDKITVAPGKPISIPLGRLGEGSPDFKFVSPNPAIRECLEVIQQSITRLANAYHISSANYSISGSQKSGFALVMENLALFEDRQNAVPFYEDGEEEMFELIKRIWNIHADYLENEHPFKGVRFSDKTHLNVTIHDVRLPQQPKDEADEWEFLIDNRMATPIDYMMLRFQMTREEAEAKYAENSNWFENSKENNVE